MGTIRATIIKLHVKHIHINTVSIICWLIDDDALIPDQTIHVTTINYNKYVMVMRQNYGRITIMVRYNNHTYACVHV
jgi:hypothetical protein